MNTESEMLISTRRRETWPRDDYRRVDRASKLLKSRNVKMSISCANPVCPEPSIALVKSTDATHGGFVLRCGCTERVLTRFF